MKNICDWNNCLEEGAYKAPVERDNSKKYRMLCLNHVKEFNKKWNYFDGMSDNQVYEFLKSDMICLSMSLKHIYFLNSFPIY